MSSIDNNSEHSPSRSESTLPTRVKTISDSSLPRSESTWSTRVKTISDSSLPRSESTWSTRLKTISDSSPRVEAISEALPSRVDRVFDSSSSIYSMRSMSVSKANLENILNENNISHISLARRDVSPGGTPPHSYIFDKDGLYRFRTISKDNVPSKQYDSIDFDKKIDTPSIFKKDYKGDIQVSPKVEGNNGKSSISELDYISGFRYNDKLFGPSKNGIPSSNISPKDISKNPELDKGKSKGIASPTNSDDNFSDNFVGVYCKNGTWYTEDGVKVKFITDNNLSKHIEPLKVLPKNLDMLPTTSISDITPLPSPKTRIDSLKGKQVIRDSVSFWEVDSNSFSNSNYESAKDISNKSIDNASNVKPDQESLGRHTFFGEIDNMYKDLYTDHNKSGNKELDWDSYSVNKDYNKSSSINGTKSNYSNESIKDSDKK